MNKIEFWCHKILPTVYDEALSYYEAICKMRNAFFELCRKVVFTVNGTAPDENGNVNLPTVSGMSSVNGIGADGNGNVQIKANGYNIYRNFFSPLSCTII